MIAPFNFPAMVPFWFLPYAIATGNTFIVKASKQVPCTMNLITEYINQTGLPAGVFNLINGDKTVADAFMMHPKVQGVSLVGSTPTCLEVAQKCAAQGKRFQAMGCKDHLVVCLMHGFPKRPKHDYLLLCCQNSVHAASAIVCVGKKRTDPYAGSL